MKGKRAEAPARKKRSRSKSQSMKEQEATVRAAGGRVRAPRQKRLPEMDDPKLDDLHSLAEDYVGIRDRRIALNKQEKPLKDNLLSAMHRYGKTHYHHNGLVIDVIHENEKVKVKFTRAETGEESEGEEAET